jgi:hypothetical protein
MPALSFYTIEHRRGGNAGTQHWFTLDRWLDMMDHMEEDFTACPEVSELWLFNHDGVDADEVLLWRRP